MARLNGLDLARFVAFAGMVVVNFKVVMGEVGGGHVLKAIAGLLDGRAAATFVVLAGIGLGLQAARLPAGLVSVTLRRSLFLMLVGLLNAVIFQADILHYYAVYFLFGLVLLRLSDRGLIVSALMLPLIYVGLLLLFDYDQGWDFDALDYVDFWSVNGFLRNLFFNGWHPVIAWQSFFLLGLWLARKPLGDPKFQKRMVVFGVAMMAVAEALSAWLMNWSAGIDPQLPVLFATYPVPPVPLYFMAGSGAALAVTGVCLRVGEWRVFAWLLLAGRQSLTLYVAHILVGMGVLDAFGMLGGQALEVTLTAALIFVILSVVYAALWARLFKRGPLESLMRRLAG